MSMPNISSITSILDTDTYKLSMQQAILFGKRMGVSYQSVDVVYEFINRGNHKFPDGFAAQLREQVNLMGDIVTPSGEIDFLRERCPYFKRAYLDYLGGYRFNPEEVFIDQNGTRLIVRVAYQSGDPVRWYRAVLWEVPLMSLISELYYQTHEMHPAEGWADAIADKGRKIKAAGIKVAEFGTRRRFSKFVQNHVVKGLKEHAGDCLVGSSNVQLCRVNDLTPIGTHAHEWFMAHAALFGYRMANRYALDAWVDEFDGNLGTALTDTFTSKVFFDQFSHTHALLFSGIRHDSGLAEAFVEMAIRAYTNHGIDPMTKTIVFSDGLTIDRAIQIAECCKDKIGCSFGIGTHLSNDVGQPPMNMVIKMTECNGHPVVKLSDEPGKHTGTKEAIEVCKQQLY